MSEGVVLRIFFALELLYPSVLHRRAALRWDVRPRGAAYQHLLTTLRQLGRGELAELKVVKGESGKRLPVARTRDLLQPSNDRETRDAEGLYLPSIVTQLWCIVNA